MRIISGICKGRKLVQIKGQQIRPTSDRIREAIFNIIGPFVRDSRVLDVFAGTGALGIEALSRGAQHAVFSDISKHACETIQKNINLCRFEEQAQIICHDIVLNPLPKEVKDKKFNLIFLDPPYNKGFVKVVLENTHFLDILEDDAIIVVEHPVEEKLVLDITGVDIYKQRKYSRTLISLLAKTQNKDEP
ncbi:MAG: 16S rRNA (guanine(966)-N(2))-methyltransferase RsmD [Desulfobacteraceae bacterium]|nr:16S rRNA (guanine(966)-N(2))-methyltransferase RsmD [Desulfobacteraceae bacterium]